MTELAIVRKAQKLGRMGFTLPVPAFEDSEGRELQGRIYTRILEGLVHKMLTPEEQATYIREGYGQCPYCEATDISGGSIEIEGNVAWQRVICSNCDRDWQDVYSLAAIDQKDEDGDTVAGGPIHAEANVTA